MKSSQPPPWIRLCLAFALALSQPCQKASELASHTLFSLLSHTLSLLNSVQAGSYHPWVQDALLPRITAKALRAGLRSAGQKFASSFGTSTVGTATFASKVGQVQLSPPYRPTFLRRTLSRLPTSSQVFTVVSADIGGHFVSLHIAQVYFYINLKREQLTNLIFSILGEGQPFSVNQF